jgi:hypothetical protein
MRASGRKGSRPHEKSSIRHCSPRPTGGESVLQAIVQKVKAQTPSLTNLSVYSLFSSDQPKENDDDWFLIFIISYCSYLVLSSLELLSSTES